MSESRFEIEFTPKAKKELRSLKQLASQATLAIFGLERDPYLGHSLSGSLVGVRSLEFNLRGSGAYRALYTIVEDEQVCWCSWSVLTKTSTSAPNDDGTRYKKQL